MNGTEPAVTSVKPAAPVVLRGVVLAPQPAAPLTRGHAQATTAPTPRSPAAARAPLTALSNVSPSLPPESDAEARERGYREGWTQGHQEATAAAREAVLSQAQGLIAEAAEAARRAAHAQHSERLEAAARQRGLEQRARIDALLASLPEAIARRLDAAEDDLLALCTELVVRLLGHAAVQPEAIRGAVSQALAQVRSRALVSIALHPDDLATLQALPDAQRWMQQQAPQLRWTANAELAAGGCLIECADGGLDARLDTQLQAFTRLLQHSREALRSTGAASPSSPPAGAPSP